MDASNFIINVWYVCYIIIIMDIWIRFEIIFLYVLIMQHVVCYIKINVDLVWRSFHIFVLSTLHTWYIRMLRSLWCFSYVSVELSDVFINFNESFACWPILNLVVLKKILAYSWLKRSLKLIEQNEVKSHVFMFFLSW